MSLSERANGHDSSGGRAEADLTSADLTSADLTSADLTSADHTWTVVVPVKPATVGKSRLAPFARDRRSELARAMALDTVTAAVACSRVAEVLVVTRDQVSGRVLAEAGAVVVPDEPERGLNAALGYAAEAAWERRAGCRVAAMLADLPALRPGELERVLDAALAFPSAFLPDADSVGTTVYCATTPAAFDPHFGLASRSAHRAAGAVELALPDVATVRRDVDTEADLREALRLGVGPRTQAALAQLL
jgi:2-phospho-L-lactate/phosphoenolpyruvate guanylyltransferase